MLMKHRIKWFYLNLLLLKILVSSIKVLSKGMYLVQNKVNLKSKCIAL
jgi:hypothetical protein